MSQLIVESYVKLSIALHLFHNLCTCHYSVLVLVVVAVAIGGGDCVSYVLVRMARWNFLFIFGTHICLYMYW